MPTAKEIFDAQMSANAEAKRQADILEREEHEKFLRWEREEKQKEEASRRLEAEKDSVARQYLQKRFRAIE